ncbi:MAG: helix-turn-helix transcriptional regulator [Anaerolineaceae bacterium]|nr:helix-turn-helix transcriptional regulator [Anaerolineaceae bacterium]
MIDLAKKRKILGLTQQEVADAAQIKRSYYGLIENGERTPLPHNAKRIASVLDFDWTLFYETPETEEKEG